MKIFLFMFIWINGHVNVTIEEKMSMEQCILEANGLIAQLSTIDREATGLENAIFICQKGTGYIA